MYAVPVLAYAAGVHPAPVPCAAAAKNTAVASRHASNSTLRLQFVLMPHVHAANTAV